MKCKNCEYCRCIGRTNKQNYRSGRKIYMCENKKVYEMKDSAGYPINNFIGYGESNINSPLTLKTTKKWCPLKEK